MEEKTQNNLSQPNSQYWNVTRWLKLVAGLIVLFGGFYFLTHLPPLPHCEERVSALGGVVCPGPAFFGGLIIMTALSLLGVPVIPVLLAGGTSWLILKELLNKH